MLNYGTYHMRFEVDGQWETSDQHGRTLLANGKEVNYIEVPRRQKITCACAELQQSQPHRPAPRRPARR